MSLPRKNSTSSQTNTNQNSKTLAHPTYKDKKYGEGFTADDYEYLCHNEFYRYLPNSKKVGHAVFYNNEQGDKVAIQYHIPNKENGSAPAVVNLTNIEEITPFPGMTRYKATGLGKTMYAKRYIHAKIGTGENESEIDIGYFSESENDNPFWGSKDKETPIFRSDLKEEQKLELEREQEEIGLVIKGGEELIINHKDVEERHKNNNRGKTQNTIMEESARDAFENFYDLMTKELSPDIKFVLSRSFKADIKKAFESNHRPEWLHAEGFSLSPLNKEPQRKENLGAAPKWSNTLMMVLERFVKWFALNRPESFLSIKPTFEMLFDSDLIKHISFEATAKEKENWITFIQEINPFQKYPVFNKASDVAQTTAIAYSVLHNVEPVGEPQVVRKAGKTKIENSQKGLLNTITYKKNTSVNLNSMFNKTSPELINTVADEQNFPTSLKHEKSVVEIITSYFVPDYEEPWKGSSLGGCRGSGFVIEHDGNTYIVTNAHCVENYSSVFVRLANDRQKKYEAEPLQISYQCDLALLKVHDPEFNKLVKPVEFGEMVKLNQDVQVIGFPMGGDEVCTTSGGVSRIQVDGYSESGDLPMLQAQIDAPINPGNSGGPVYSNGKVVGVAFQGMDFAQNIGYMIPIPILKHFLTECLTKKEYRGFPVLSIGYQKLENEYLRELYGMSADQTGVCITGVNKLSDAHGKLKKDDVILEIDSHKISNEGTVDIPNIGNCIDLRHITHEKYIGDTVDLKVLRKNEEIYLDLAKMKLSLAELQIKPNEKKNISELEKQIENLKTQLYEIHLIKVVLDHVPLETQMVGQSEHDKEPTYYFASGVCFTPYTRNYMEYGYGEADNMYVWEAGCFLEELSKKNPSEEKVVIAKVLTSEATASYDKYEGTFISSINGKHINNIHDVVEAIESNHNKIHEIVTFKNRKIALKNMSAEEHNKLLRKNKIHKDRSEDLMPNSLDKIVDDLMSKDKVEPKKPVIFNNSSKTSNVSMPHTKPILINKSKKVDDNVMDEEISDKNLNKLKSQMMTKGQQRYFDTIARIEDKAMTSSGYEGSDEDDEDFSIEIDESESSCYEDENGEISLGEEEDIIAENKHYSKLSHKKPQDERPRDNHANRFFADRSLKRGNNFNNDDEVEHVRKRQKRR